MAEEISGSSPVTSQNQPSTLPTSTPSIDHYKSLVEMAEKGMGRIHDEYKRYIWALATIISVGIIVVGIFTYKTISDFRGDIRKEADVTRSVIQREPDLHKETAKNELTNYLNKQIAEQFGTQRIQETLEKVAATEAKGIIEKKIEPEFVRSKDTIGSLQGELRQDVDKIRADFKSESEDLRIARIKIEEKLAPRNLSIEQQENISSKVKAFAGQPFTIITYPDDGETLSLAGTLDRVLISAGWVGVPVKEFLGFSLIVGIVIKIAPSRASDFKKVADALSSALVEERIVAKVEVDPEARPNAIQIRVGKKP